MTLRRVSEFALAHPRWIVAFGAAAAYANTIQNGPVLDDNYVIFDNPLLKSFRNVAVIFRHSYGGTQGGLYRPVTSLSYALNWWLGGLNVVGYHIFNIALHVCCCILVLELGRLLWNASRAADPTSPASASPPLLGALLFAVHPVHSEAVAALAGRGDCLAALGSLACLYLTATRHRVRWRYPAALIALVGGMLSKENAAVTPLLFALIAYALPGAMALDARPSLASAPGRGALRQAGMLAAGMVVVLGICLLIRPTAAAIPVEFQRFSGAPRSLVFNTMTRVIAEYLRLLVFPHPLGIDFYYLHKIPFTPSFTLVCLRDTVVWLAVLGAGVAMLRRAPVVGVGIVWVFLALLPVLNIVPTGVLMAERLLYLPSAGFCIAAGAGLSLIVASLERRGHARLAALTGGAAVIVGLALAGKGWIRNREWRSAQALLESELRGEPDDPMVNNLLAIEYLARGALVQARARLEVAVRSEPRYAPPYVNLGLVAHKLDDDSAAIQWLELARRLDPRASDPLFFMGVVRADQGNLARAVDLLSQAELLAPEEAWTHACRGLYLTRLKQRAEGQQEMDRARELDPAVALANCSAANAHP